MPSQLLVHDWVTPCGMRPASPNPSTRQASSPVRQSLPELLPSPTMLPPFFMFIDKLGAHFLSHQTANSGISCMLRITNLHECPGCSVHVVCALDRYYWGWGMRGGCQGFCKHVRMTAALSRQSSTHCPSPCAMPLESCQSWLSVGATIGVFSLRGQRFSRFLILFPAKFLSTVSTNCQGSLVSS